MKKYIKLIVGALLFAAIFTAYLTRAPYLLYFFEQHHLFLYSWDYISHEVHLHGPAWTAAEFMVQFGYYPALGAAVWALYFTLIYLMLQSIVFRLTGLRELSQLTVLVPMYLFSRTVLIDVFPASVMSCGFWIFVAWAVIMAVSPLLRRKLPVRDLLKGKWVAPASIALGLLFIGVGYRVWTHPTLSGAQHEATWLMLDTEKAMKAEDWPTVVKLGNEWAATGRQNHLMSYFRAIGLAKTNQLYDHILDYDQDYGPQSLYFEWKADRNIAEYGHYVFEHLGSINEAQRWSFEAMVGWGENPNLLRNLVRFNIEMGRPLVADRFLRKLEQSLFYRGEAKRLRDCLAKGRVPELHNSLRNAPQEPARFSNTLNIGAESKYVLLNDPDNEMAKQYLMTTMLLANNLGAFLRNLQEYYPGSENPQLPRIFEEALVMYRMMAGSAAIRDMGYTISPDTEARFRNFLTEHKAGRYSPESRRTYWYYINKVSPLGREISLD